VTVRACIQSVSPECSMELILPLKNAPYVGDMDPHQTPFGPPESTSPATSRSVQPFLQGSWSLEPRYSVSSNRLICHIYLVLQCCLIITSGRSNLTTGRIAATHGWFSGIRLVAPVCTPHSTFPWVHPSPYPKRHLDRFSRPSTAHWCDRQTDRPRYSDCSNRLHLCM